MKVVKIGSKVYVDGILQHETVDLRANSWMKSVVEGKQYIFHVDTMIFAETDSFEMVVDDSNIPAEEMRKGKYVHGNSPLAQNMHNATQKEIEDFLREKEAETEFSLELNCNFSNGNSSFGFQAMGNLSRVKIQQFQDDLKELCNKYKKEE
jgi:hypothetical protein